MTVIRKKTVPEYFDQIANGKKTFDLRLNDFEIQEGDTLILEEWDDAKKAYTGRTIEKQVSGVNQFNINNLFWPKEDILEKGIQIISFK